jgi:DNA polymerase (family 10)
VENVDIARVFEQVADLLEIQSESPFRVRAYRAAARTVRSLGEPAAAIVAREGEPALTRLPGIGKDLASKIGELLRTGDLTVRRELVAKVPEGVVELMQIPSLGAKRAHLVYEELGVATVAELEEAARTGRLRAVRGFGDKLVATILEGCAMRKAAAGRTKLAEAEAYVAPLLVHLRGARGLDALEVAGSFRRRRETVGDVDILAGSNDPAAVAARLFSYPEITRVLARGETKCAVVLRSGLQIDVRIVAPESFGAALHYFTGSKAHCIAVRALGMKRGLKINEYGVFRGDQRVGGRTEADVFHAIGLPWIPPELREDSGEIAAAREGRLPELVELAEIKGDLHLHTTATDGRDDLEAMIAACEARGYEYVAITDHTRAVRVAGGMDRAGFREQARAIARIRRRAPGLTILHGAEVDILGDGSLDLDDATLAELDYVVASVHSKFGMSKDEMTKRILRALANPHVTALGHPTGRLLGKREPYAVDLARLAHAAHALGVLLEVNAQPDRLDLCDVHARLAKEAGALLVVVTDAHSVSELDFMRHGIDQARRGWCTRADVANTAPVAELLTLIGRRRIAAATRRFTPLRGARERRPHS